MKDSLDVDILFDISKRQDSDSNLKRIAKSPFSTDSQGWFTLLLLSYNITCNEQFLIHASTQSTRNALRASYALLKMGYAVIGPLLRLHKIKMP